MTEENTEGRIHAQRDFLESLPLKLKELQAKRKELQDKLPRVGGEEEHEDVFDEIEKLQGQIERVEIYLKHYYPLRDRLPHRSRYLVAQVNTDCVHLINEASQRTVRLDNITEMVTGYRPCGSTDNLGFCLVLRSGRCIFLTNQEDFDDVMNFWEFQE